TVDYAFQDINDIPGTLPEGRTKPWGPGLFFNTIRFLREQMIYASRKRKIITMRQQSFIFGTAEYITK
ncbi:hypothetical protein, partial [Hominenteromicrobium sp.]|uniref:hypothetical protein n=1 Tax=Hominenteromicrobium sp. TaxID=3073581 RepID=UPI003AEF8725